MKSRKRIDVPTSELVDRFVKIALAQDEAQLYGYFKRYNQLYEENEQLEAELKNRSGDERRLLAPLYEHPNAQVRLNAALATLAVNPEAARRTLQIISDRDEYPQAADARGMMRALDEGSYVPS